MIADAAERERLAREEEKARLRGQLVREAEYSAEQSRLDAQAEAAHRAQVQEMQKEQHEEWAAAQAESGRQANEQTQQILAATQQLVAQSAQNAEQLARIRAQQKKP